MSSSDIPMTESSDPFILYENYRKLTAIHWQAADTKKISWRREGNAAIGRFGCLTDAALFVRGFLDGWGVFTKRYTADALKYRGRVCEELLPKESNSDQVQLPKNLPYGKSLEISIPLNLLSPAGLDGLLERQARLLARPKTTIPVKEGFKSDL